MLISGEHRKRNIPGGAFRKGAGKLLANARGLVSPAGLASPANSVRSTTGVGRWVVWFGVAGARGLLKPNSSH